MPVAVPDRRHLIQRGRKLEYFTLAYNSVEDLISIIAGFLAGSASLVGFRRGQLD